LGSFDGGESDDQQDNDFKLVGGGVILAQTSPIDTGFLRLEIIVIYILAERRPLQTARLNGRLHYKGGRGCG
jgi:hypothetical protein